MQRAIILWFRRHHRVVIALAAAGVLGAVGALLTFGLHEDYTIDAFVGSTNREFDTFEEFRTTFATSEPALIAVKGAEVLDDETLDCLNTIVPQVQALPAVRRATAISQIAFGRSLWLQHPLVKGVLISHDQKTAAIILQMHTEEQAGDTRPQTVAALRRIVGEARQSYPDLEIILSGPYVTMLEMFEFVREDLKLFSISVAALMVVVLYWVIGSWRVAVYAVGVAAAAVLCTLGVTIAARINMSLTTQMIVIMVAILAVASCVHLAVGFAELADRAPSQRRPGDHRHSDRDTRAAILTLQVLAPPCTAVILTSAAGFASLCISDIQPIRSFGAIMVLGLLLALLLAFSGVFYLRTRDARSNPRSRFHDWLARRLGRLADLALRNRVLVIAAAAVLATVLAIPIPRLSFESNFVKNFRRDSAVRRGYEFIEENLTPLGAIEAVLRRRNGGPAVDLHAMQACSAVARQAVADHQPIRKGVSLLDLLRSSPDDAPSSEADLQVRFRTAQHVLPALFGPGVLQHFVTEDLSTLRISLLAREAASVWEKIDLGEDVRRMCGQHFGEEYEVTVTGLYYFYATLIAGLLRDQNITFALTLAAIFTIAALLLRSWRLAAMSMIPNLFPVVACLGLMGWLQIPINMATSMMLAISLGIAVDDTVHYLWRFRRELQYDGDTAAAILRSHRSVGQACVFTTVVITGGFWILCFSRFLPTVYFGALIGLTMLVALAADLILLPALLMTFKPVRTRTESEGPRIRGSEDLRT